jgi:hypothetical protein
MDRWSWSGPAGFAEAIRFDQLLGHGIAPRRGWEAAHSSASASKAKGPTIDSGTVSAGPRRTTADMIRMVLLSRLA